MIAQQNATQCAGRNARGEPCGAHHIHNSLYCFVHTPSARLRATRSRAGASLHAQLRRGRLARDVTRALAGRTPRRLWWEDDE